MTITEIIVTILLGTAAGFINTFAGGGSMLVVPFLIFIGLPANVANATNRIAILLQNVVSVSGFKQKKILDFKTDSKLLLPVALGSIVGAFIAVDIYETLSSSSWEFTADLSKSVSDSSCWRGWFSDAVMIY